MDAELDGRMCEFPRARRFQRARDAAAIRPTPDATIVLGLADLALEFARDPADEVDRWLTLLACYGDAGLTLRAAGLSEGSLHTDAPRESRGTANADAADVVRAVTSAALRGARARARDELTTTDLLLAVAEIYGPLFYRALASAAAAPRRSPALAGTAPAHGARRGRRIARFTRGERGARSSTRHN